MAELGVIIAGVLMPDSIVNKSCQFDVSPILGVVEKPKSYRLLTRPLCLNGTTYA